MQINDRNSPLWGWGWGKYRQLGSHLESRRQGKALRSDIKGEPSLSHYRYDSNLIYPEVKKTSVDAVHKSCPPKDQHEHVRAWKKLYCNLY